MIRKIESEHMGKSRRGWLTSWFHFSFAEYYNPDNIHFGALRVINDDLIEPHTGFDTHPHRDMEIITYVVMGELTHIDSMKNERVLKRGEIQYMSAGTGVLHSEYNNSDTPLRLLQIWILPDREGYPPQYGEERFAWQERTGRFLHLVSGEDKTAPVRIHQDVNLYAAELLDGKLLEFDVRPGRQAYLVLVEGEAEVNGVPLSERDAMEIVLEKLKIAAKPYAHILLFEMAREGAY